MIESKLVKLYEKMLLIRFAEERIAQHYLENKIFSFVHFSTGQEAVAVGVTEALPEGRRILGNHRSHGHYLASGGNLEAMFAEMLGKESGCCRGKGGSMHMIDKSAGFMGSTPILSSNLPIAAGSALEQKLRDSKLITVVFLGDGAAEEGEFFETLNFASLNALRLLVVVENNHLAVLTRNSARKPPEFSYESICLGFGIPYRKSDGNDVISVMDQTHALLEQMDKLQKPAVLEAEVFRHMAHSSPLKDDHLGLRTIDTEDERTRLDCIVSLRNLLLRELDNEVISGIELRIVAHVESSLTSATLASEPPVDALLQDLYA